jgi:hypothetical protein
MKLKKILLLLIISISATLKPNAQQLNLPGFDNQLWHFGFALSFNKADLYIQQSFTPITSDSLHSLYVNPASGFTLGVVSSINFTPNFKLRFAIPSLSFQERTLEYTFRDSQLPDTSVFWTKSIRPVYLDFPVLLKCRTNRIDNWAVYAITGLRFGVDMASDKDVDNDTPILEDQVVKLKKTDFGLEIGGGFDFFLEYFKLGLELKLGVGMKNIHLNDNTHFDSPIESLRSKVWTFSITFEG